MQPSQTYNQTWPHGFVARHAGPPDVCNVELADGSRCGLLESNAIHHWQQPGLDLDALEQGARRQAVPDAPWMNATNVIALIQRLRTLERVLEAAATWAELCRAVYDPILTPSLAELMRALADADPTWTHFNALLNELNSDD